jgi:hypothetical protein
MDPGLLFALIVVGFPIAFMALWSLILLILSSLGGWRELALWYRAAALPPEAERKSGVSLAMGRGWMKVSYRSGVQLGVTPDGIGLKPILVLGLFHPPLFLPFGEMDVRFEKKFIGRYYRLTPNRSQAMAILLPGRIGDWIEGVRSNPPPKFTLDPSTD